MRSSAPPSISVPGRSATSESKAVQPHRSLLDSVKEWATGRKSLSERSRAFPDLPPFERLRKAPVDYPRITWLPDGYRPSYIARGANVGFQVPDEILFMFGHPGAGVGGPPYALQLFATRAANVRLAATHLNGSPGPVRVTSVTVDDSAVTAVYYDGEFRGDSQGDYRSRQGKRFRWSRDNKHALVFQLRDFVIGIRGPRLGGVQEFDLYAMAESIRTT